MSTSSPSAGPTVTRELALARSCFFCASCRYGYTNDVSEYLRAMNSAFASSRNGQGSIKRDGSGLYDACGVSGLHFAAGHGHTEIVTVILNSGLLSVDAEELGCTSGRIASGNDRSRTSSLQASAGRTALHWAAAAGHAHIVELLLKRDAWADATDSLNGDTAMHYAVRCGGNEGILCVDVLLSKGAAITVKNQAGLCPLDEAILRGDPLMIKTMRRLRPNDVPRLLRGSKPIPGVSLLHVAAAVGTDAGVKILLNERYDQHSKDNLRYNSHETVSEFINL